MKPLTKINADVICTFICKKIIPRIKKVWPKDMNKECKVQWDNAKVHVSAYDLSLLECLTTGGWNIDVVMQPAKSPDLNILDLGYFNSLQTLQYTTPVKNVEELALAVFKAWDMLNPDSLRKIWYTLQRTMDLILSVDGNNNYKIGHSGRNKKSSGIDMTSNYVSKYRGPHAESIKESVCLASYVHFAGSDRDDNSVVSYDSGFEEVEYDA